MLKIKAADDQETDVVVTEATHWGVIDLEERRQIFDADAVALHKWLQVALPIGTLRRLRKLIEADNEIVVI